MRCVITDDEGKTRIVSITHVMRSLQRLAADKARMDDGSIRKGRQ